ncbi:MAG: pyrophosphatase [Candidatus Dojkabacteria bacterium]|nr:pyrophosphatase [Candidatus Dojkabacteria bacterium]
MERLIENYINFIENNLSNENKNLENLIDRLSNLQKENKNINFSSLIGSCLGLIGEAGETTEIVKKIIMQGKNINEETLEKLKKEIGDITFYYFMLLNSLNFDIKDIIQTNMEKLKNRYGNNGFSVEKSENRIE